MQKVRKALRIVIQIGILSLFFIVGATIQEYFNLVIPGSVIGLVLLFLCLFFNVWGRFYDKAPYYLFYSSDGWDFKLL